MSIINFFKKSRVGVRIIKIKKNEQHEKVQNEY